jgi:hypothetical protein
VKDTGMGKNVGGFYCLHKICKASFSIPYLICTITMSIDLYPAIVFDEDIKTRSAGSDVGDVCQEIYDACKGFGTDEK